MKIKGNSPETVWQLQFKVKELFLHNTGTLIVSSTNYFDKPRYFLLIEYWVELFGSYCLMVCPSYLTSHPCVIIVFLHSGHALEQYIRCKFDQAISKGLGSCLCWFHVCGSHIRPDFHLHFCANPLGNGTLKPSILSAIAQCFSCRTVLHKQRHLNFRFMLKETKGWNKERKTVVECYCMHFWGDEW